jgi:hypothetical protein
MSREIYINQLVGLPAHYGQENGAAGDKSKVEWATVSHKPNGRSSIPTCQVDLKMESLGNWVWD